MSGYTFKQDLARLYFPGRDKEVSRRLFAREIHSNADLMAELIAAKYVKTRKQLTPPFRCRLSSSTLENPEARGLPSPLLPVCIAIQSQHTPSRP